MAVRWISNEQIKSGVWVLDPASRASIISCFLQGMLVEGERRAVYNHLTAALSVPCSTPHVWLCQSLRQPLGDEQLWWSGPRY